MIDSLDGVPHVHGGGVCLDTIEDLVQHSGHNEIHGHVFFVRPSLARCLAIDVSGGGVGLGHCGGCEVVRPLARSKCKGHTIPVRDPVQAI